MKAIILTYAPVPESEQELLKSTKIFKLALNQHAEEFNPDMRICTDYILSDLCRNFSQRIVSVREKFRFTTDRIEYFPHHFKGATILSAIEYLIHKGYDKILIIGDNRVNTKTFQDNVNYHIRKLRHKANLYQYSNGNFMLPIRGITEFIYGVDLGFWDKNGVYQEDFQILDSKEL